MMKIGSTQIASVAARSAACLRSQAEKIASLEQSNIILVEEVVEMRREREVTKLAQTMEDKGLNADLSLDEKIAHIRRYDDLSKIGDAIELASNGVSIANVSDDPGRGTLSDTLTSFCLGGE